MTRNQRLGFVAIAAVIAVVAIFLFASGPDETAEDADNPAQQQTATPTATEEQQEASPQETETPTPTPTPRPQPPLLTADEVKTIRFTEGETVRFRVRSDAPDHIHVHGYDLMKDVEAGKTTTMSFKASITGIFEIELEDAHAPIGELRVDPE
jgi:FtsP/CotA-like multicopper oxidase with cupredoxin domain